MLTRRLGALLLAVVVAIVVSAPSAYAGWTCRDGLCCNEKGDCYVQEIIPGPPGGPGDPGDPGDPGTPIGGGDPCGYTLVQPQPLASDPIWGGTDPAKADVYEKVCPGLPPELVVLGAGIGALPEPMAPAELAQIIIARLQMLPPPIETMPPEGSEGAITGIPVWLWIAEGPQTTGPLTDSDAAGGVAVRVTAQVTKVTWDLGDGTLISCGIGTPYDGSANPSPDCGHVYEVKSTKADPNGAYTITATATWTINWSGGGDSGTEIQQFSSTSTMRVTEINVVNVPDVTGG